MSKYGLFDRSRLAIKPLADRVHDLQLENWLSLDDPTPPFAHPELPVLLERWKAAKTNGKARVVIMGAHVLRAGVNRFLMDLMQQGWITHLAFNGAGLIHDYELARIGATTESVAKYVSDGQFGLWQETGELNHWITQAAQTDEGLGEFAGRQLNESLFAHRDLSVFAAAYRCAIPATVHAGIGYDILHEHPNFDGAALGKTSYRDFLMFAHAVQSLEGGIVLNFGSAIMGPEVFLKALAMARNVAHQKQQEIKRFTVGVFDFVPIDGDFRKELPKSDPGYYFRPHKTLLVRTVADGGESFYFNGHHRATIPALWKLLSRR
jgi:hypothetical protein